MWDRVHYFFTQPRRGWRRDLFYAAIFCTTIAAFSILVALVVVLLTPKINEVPIAGSWMRTENKLVFIFVFPVMLLFMAGAMIRGLFIERSTQADIEKMDTFINRFGLLQQTGLAELFIRFLIAAWCASAIVCLWMALNHCLVVWRLL